MTAGGTVRGLAVITFENGSAKELWDAGRGWKWPTRKGRTRPHAHLTRVATVRADPVYPANAQARKKSGRASLPFTSFALVEAESEGDLRRVGRYIEEHFSHVEVYAFRSDFGG